MVERDLVSQVNQELRKLRSESQSERAVTFDHFTRLLNCLIKLSLLDGEADGESEPVSNVVEIAHDTPVAANTPCAHDLSVFDGICRRCGYDSKEV